MNDSTSLLISFRASPTPIDTATPARPNPAASEAEPAVVVMIEVSTALSVTDPARMPVAPSPSM